MFWFFCPQGMWCLNSPTRDGTRTLDTGKWSLNHETAREVPYISTFKKRSLWYLPWLSMSTQILYLKLLKNYSFSGTWEGTWEGECRTFGESLPLWTCQSSYLGKWTFLTNGFQVLKLTQGSYPLSPDCLSFISYNYIDGANPYFLYLYRWSKKPSP